MIQSALTGVRIAIEGCGHGTLNAIYASVEQSAKAKGWAGVDLVIIGGDFQAVRNSLDLNCMAVPVKYREIGDFHEYYSGKRKAPYTTIFVGGNHEASNHLWELYYGGWVAPNIYYMGAANVLRLGPLRLAGLSGIWKGYNYKKHHYERLPYNQDDVRSVYHVRELDTRKLLQVRTQVDIGISHDWPRGVEWLGDWKYLFRKKDQFEADAKANQLGSVAAKLVLERLRPKYWFSAHLHIKYAALIEHKRDESGSVATSTTNLPDDSLSKPTVNAEEIDLDLDDIDRPDVPARNTEEIDLDDDENLDHDAVESNVSAPLNQNPNVDSIQNLVDPDIRAQLPSSFAKPEPDAKLPEPPSEIFNNVTQFLALDKCLPRRDFLQLLEIQPLNAPGQPDLLLQRPFRLEYDPEWLAITRVFANDLQIGGDPNAAIPADKGRAKYLPLIQKEIAWVEENITKADRLVVPENFSLTAPVYDPDVAITSQTMPSEYNNAQTVEYCNLLNIPNSFLSTDEENRARLEAGSLREQPRNDNFGHNRNGPRGGPSFRTRGRGGNRGRGHGYGRGHGRGRGRGQ